MPARSLARVAAPPPRSRSQPQAAGRKRRRCRAEAAAGSHVLVADIGGTNARFQVWQLDDQLKPGRLVLEQFLATKDHPDFEQALGEVLRAAERQAGAHPAAAAFACAGPVERHTRCQFTNLGWTVDAEAVTRDFGCLATVLNDFEAVGYGIPVLPGDAIVPLHAVPPEAHAPLAVLGPGTGLGQAQLFWEEGVEAGAGAYRVQPSEGAHATFAPRGARQRALQAAVEEEEGYCCIERVACGAGLVRIYRFLAEDAGRPVVYKTPAAVSTAALAGFDPLAVEALDMLLEIVGAEAGHMALRGLATGGVYICGGIFPKVLPRVLRGGVRDAFLWRASPFHGKVLARVPLYLVTEERLGLLGARAQAVELLARR